MLFDDILCKIGEFGIYQVVLYVLLGLVGIPTGWQHFSFYYLSSKQDFFCKIPRLENFTLERQKYIGIPYDVTTDSGNAYSQCLMYDLRWETYTTSELERWNRSAIYSRVTSSVTCDEYVFDTSQIKSTLTSTHQLVCDNAYKLEQIQTLYSVGMMVGAILFGSIADRFGRHKTLIATLFLEMVFGVAAAFVEPLDAFYAMRFCSGIAIAGAFNTAFVMVMEIIGPHRRMGAGVFVQAWLSVGIMTLPGIAYSAREQRKLQFLLALPVGILLTYYWIVPESPRWCAARGHFDESERVLRRMAAVNGRELPHHLHLEENRTHDDFARLNRNPSLIDFLLTRNMRTKSLIMCFIWFSTSFIYYTLNHHIGEIATNIYLVGFLSGLTEIPGYFLAVVAINKLGRRWPLVVLLVTSGIICIICICFLSHRDFATSLTVCALTGKQIMATVLAVTYVYAAELFPTNVRCTGIGMLGVPSGLGSLLSRLCYANMVNSFPPLGMIAAAMSAVASAMFAILLPETLNHDLPETLVDGEKFGGDCIEKFFTSGKIHASFIVPRERTPLSDIGPAVYLLGFDHIHRLHPRLTSTYPGYPGKRIRSFYSRSNSATTGKTGSSIQTTV